jgi:phosphatidylglycerol:prolipoprotein diacylglycerol transferase
MLYLGLVAGMVAGNYAANVAGLDSARVLVATVVLLVPALVGARLLFVATHWDLYRSDPRRIWRRSEGGAAMLGGLSLALLASLPLLAVLDISPGAFWDVAIFTILVGMIPARVGCLLHGCCGGRPTDGRLALSLPDHLGTWRRRIPTQILEAGWGLLLLVGAVAVWSHRPFPGAVFLAAAVGYSLGRLVLQPTREIQDRLGPLNVQQVLTAALGIFALSGFLAAWLRSAHDL